MQTSWPELTDMRDEPTARGLYTATKQSRPALLLQLPAGAAWLSAAWIHADLSAGWDVHSNAVGTCLSVRRDGCASYALVTDLKRRGTTG